jgi:spore maturation protein CgeB
MKIENAGYERAKKNHTYIERAKNILNIINNK